MVRPRSGCGNRTGNQVSSNTSRQNSDSRLSDGRKRKRSSSDDDLVLLFSDSDSSTKYKRPKKRLRSERKSARARTRSHVDDSGSSTECFPAEPSRRKKNYLPSDDTDSDSSYRPLNFTKRTIRISSDNSSSDSESSVDSFASYFGSFSDDSVGSYTEESNAIQRAGRSRRLRTASRSVRKRNTRNNNTTRRRNNRTREEVTTVRLSDGLRRHSTRGRFVRRTRYNVMTTDDFRFERRNERLSRLEDRSPTPGPSRGSRILTDSDLSSGDDLPGSSSSILNSSTGSAFGRVVLTIEGPGSFDVSERIPQTHEVEILNDPDTDPENQVQADPPVELDLSGYVSSDGGSDKCPICLIKFVEQEVGVPGCCEHNFCASCIVKWADSSTTCPVDRRSFTTVTVNRRHGGKPLRRLHFQARTLPSESMEIHINDPVTCVVCRVSGRDEELAFCDRCVRPYHISCLNPPLSTVPDSWYCPTCSLDNHFSEDSSESLSELDEFLRRIPRRREGYVRTIDFIYGDRRTTRSNRRRSVNSQGNEPTTRTDIAECVSTSSSVENRTQLFNFSVRPVATDQRRRTLNISFSGNRISYTVPPMVPLPVRERRSRSIQNQFERTVRRNPPISLFRIQATRSNSSISARICVSLDRGQIAATYIPAQPRRNVAGEGYSLVNVDSSRPPMLMSNRRINRWRRTIYHCDGYSYASIPAAIRSDVGGNESSSAQNNIVGQSLFRIGSEVESSQTNNRRRGSFHITFSGNVISFMITRAAELSSDTNVGDNESIFMQNNTHTSVTNSSSVQSSSRTGVSEDRYCIVQNTTGAQLANSSSIGRSRKANSVTNVVEPSLSKFTGKRKCNSNRFLPFANETNEMSFSLSSLNYMLENLTANLRIDENELNSYEEGEDEEQGDGGVGLLLPRRIFENRLFDRIRQNQKAFAEILNLPTFFYVDTDGSIDRILESELPLEGASVNRSILNEVENISSPTRLNNDNKNNDKIGFFEIILPVTLKITENSSSADHSHLKKIPLHEANENEKSVPSGNNNNTNNNNNNNNSIGFRGTTSTTTTNSNYNNNNSNSFSSSQLTSFSSGGFNRTSRPGFSNILENSLEAVDFSPFKNTAPIKFRMNAPTKPSVAMRRPNTTTTTHNNNNNNNNNSSLVTLPSSSLTCVVVAPLKRPPTPPSFLDIPTSPDLTGGDVSAGNSGSIEDDIDIYGDIESTPITAMKLEDDKNFSSLQPPPIPSALLDVLSMDDNDNNNFEQLVKYDDDDDDDDKSSNGLVIDDSASGSINPNDIYDPTQPNEDSDNEGYEKNENHSKPDYMLSPVYERMVVYGPHLPLPKPPEPPAICDIVTAQSDSDDDTFGCPNFSNYSLSSMKLLKKEENSSMALKLDDIPIPTDKITSEDLSSIPVPPSLSADKIPIPSESVSGTCSFSSITTAAAAAAAATCSTTGGVVVKQLLDDDDDKVEKNNLSNVYDPDETSSLEGNSSDDEGDRKNRNENNEKLENELIDDQLIASSTSSNQGEQSFTDKTKLTDDDNVTETNTEIKIIAEEDDPLINSSVEKIGEEEDDDDDDDVDVDDEENDEDECENVIAIEVTEDEEDDEEELADEHTPVRDELTDDKLTNDDKTDDVTELVADMNNEHNSVLMMDDLDPISDVEYNDLQSIDKDKSKYNDIDDDKDNSDNYNDYKDGSSASKKKKRKKDRKKTTTNRNGNDMETSSELLSQQQQMAEHDEEKRKKRTKPSERKKLTVTNTNTNTNLNRSRRISSSSSGDSNTNVAKRNKQSTIATSNTIVDNDRTKKLRKKNDDKENTMKKDVQSSSWKRMSKTKRDRNYRDGKEPIVIDDKRNSNNSNNNYYNSGNKVRKIKRRGEIVRYDVRKVVKPTTASTSRKRSSSLLSWSRSRSRSYDRSGRSRSPLYNNNNNNSISNNNKSRYNRSSNNNDPWSIRWSPVWSPPRSVRQQQKSRSPAVRRRSISRNRSRRYYHSKERNRRKSPQKDRYVSSYDKSKRKRVSISPTHDDDDDGRYRRRASMESPTTTTDNRRRKRRKRKNDDNRTTSGYRYSKSPLTPTYEPTSPPESPILLSRTPPQSMSTSDLTTTICIPDDDSPIRHHHHYYRRGRLNDRSVSGNYYYNDNNETPWSPSSSSRPVVSSFSPPPDERHHQRHRRHHQHDLDHYNNNNNNCNNNNNNDNGRRYSLSIERQTRDVLSPVSDASTSAHKNLTVIVPNNSNNNTNNNDITNNSNNNNNNNSAVESSMKKKRLKKKTKEKGKSKNDNNNKQKKRKKKKRAGVPVVVNNAIGSTANKEIFASGENILVSVSFNSDDDDDDGGRDDVNKTEKRRRVAGIRRPSEELNINKLITATSANSNNNGNSRTSRNKRKKKVPSNVPREVLNAKPVAVIDLNLSPFKEIASSPVDVISLTDDDSADDIGGKHQSSTTTPDYHLLPDDDRHHHNRIEQDDCPQTPPGAPESGLSLATTTINSNNNNDNNNSTTINTITTTTATMTTTTTTTTTTIDPTTTTCNNNNFDIANDTIIGDEDGAMNKGPYTPPVSVSACSTSVISGTAMYDPFEPTKSPTTPESNVALNFENNNNNNNEDKIDSRSPVVSQHGSTRLISPTSRLLADIVILSDNEDKENDHSGPLSSLSSSIIDHPTTIDKQPTSTAMTTTTTAVNKIPITTTTNLITAKPSPEKPSAIPSLFTTSANPLFSTVNNTLFSNKLLNSSVNVNINEPLFPNIVPWKLPSNLNTVSNAATTSITTTSLNSVPPFTTSLGNHHKNFLKSLTTTISTQYSHNSGNTATNNSSHNNNNNNNNSISSVQTAKDIINREGRSSPYSPDTSEGDDIFEPPPASPGSSPVSNGKSFLDHQSYNKSKTTAGNTADALFSSTAKYSPTRESHKLSSFRVAKRKRKSDTSKADKDKLTVLDDVPNSAVELAVKEKFMQKLRRQERVAEEVKIVLRPHYAKKHITKDEYKDILRKAVPKICHNKSGDINPKKIHGLIEAYVRNIRHRNKPQSGHSVATSSAAPVSVPSLQQPEVPTLSAPILPGLVPMNKLPLKKTKKHWA